MMIKILILTCGTNANYHISKIIKEKFPDDFYLIGTDINKEWEIPTSPYLDEFYQSPLTKEESYYGFIINICKRKNINYILPSFDADQHLFYDGNEDLSSLGVKSLGINRSILSVYSNKEKMNIFLRRNGLPIPKTYKLEDIEPADIYFVKPLQGVGSDGARKMMGSEIDLEIEKYNVIEECCSGPEVTLECFNYHNELYTVARQRIAQKSGVCTKAKVYYDEELTTIACLFAKSIQLPYIFNLQFMKNQYGGYVITDVNLRTAGGMSLSYAAGWDEVSALASILRGDTEEEIKKHIQPATTQYVMRAYTDIVTKKIKKKIAFDLDGTLLDSRLRHQKVMDDVLKEFGIHLDTSNLVAFKSEGCNNILWLTEHKVEENVAKLIQKRWIEKIETQDYLEYDQLYPKTLSVLIELSRDNDLFILTARNNEYATRRQIKSLGILQYFTDVYVVPSDSKTPHNKADILIENGIDEYIGDTESDLKAAEKAGCSFKAFIGGFRSKSFWEKYNVKFFN